MTDFTANNRLLIFFIIIGLFASLAVNWQRHLVEDANSNVEIIMAYDDIADLARTEGIAPDSLFRRFKEAGITSLAISETTLESLSKNGKLTAVSGAFVLQGRLWGRGADSFGQKLMHDNLTYSIDAKDVYVLTDDQQLFNEVKDDLERRLSPARVKVLSLSEGALTVLAVKADYDKVLEWNLGLSSRQLQEAVEYGFYVVPRPSNYTMVAASDVDAVFERLSTIDRGKISAVVFTGSEALGYPDLLPATAGHFKKNGFTLGLIEHVVQLQFFNQDGVLPLSRALDYKAVRLYAIGKGEQVKLSVNEASRRFANSARERNIRLHLLKPFEKAAPGKDLIQTNLDYVASVKGALLAKGFKLGQAEPFRPYFASSFLLALVAIGVSCASALLLANIFHLKNRWQYIIALSFAIILTFPVLKGAGTLARQAAALASVCCFPVLAVSYQADYFRRRLTAAPDLPFGKMLLLGAGALLSATIASLAGGLYAGAILSDIRFFLEIEIFRGVKLSFVAPLILITLVYLARLSEQNDFDEQTTLWQKIRQILNYQVFVKTIFLVGAAAAVIFIFIGRSGHTAGVPVPDIEVKMRLFLEQVLYARPREKEFLIGHPAFLLFLGAMRFKLSSVYQYILLVAATIGQSSVAETFAHMRTPVFMSVVRGLDGLVLGLIMGVFALGAFYALMRLTAFRQREKGVI